jgi:hypothetical protein
MGLASIYFSANKMELHEWLDGRMDIKWSRLVDEENGVLQGTVLKICVGGECGQNSEDMMLNPNITFC